MTTPIIIHTLFDVVRCCSMLFDVVSCSMLCPVRCCVLFDVVSCSMLFDVVFLCFAATLLNLHMAGNSIGSWSQSKERAIGMRSICKYIARNTTLRHLELSNNMLDVRE
jgi:hypothetical protein